MASLWGFREAFQEPLFHPWWQWVGRFGKVRLAPVSAALLDSESFRGGVVWASLHRFILDQWKYEYSTLTPLVSQMWVFCQWAIKPVLTEFVVGTGLWHVGDMDSESEDTPTWWQLWYVMQEEQRNHQLFFGRERRRNQSLERCR